MTENMDRNIAVVGMACRLPGNVRTLAGFWDLIEKGSQPWSDVPEERYNWKSYRRASSTSTFSTHTNHRGGHFLGEDIKGFDAAFFGISPREAQAMDPQQRFLLEVTFEAVENAGISMKKLRGSNTGVYIAAFNDDYRKLTRMSPAEMPAYAEVGTGDAILSNRISYQFDLKGPSFTLNTGCSGSMVALHAAYSALRNGEVDTALVGGANLMLAPDLNIMMTRLGLLNSDGRSYAFDSRGDGYGRGEGIAMVVLKRSRDAQNTDWPIHAIIRNVAVGHDGRTDGILRPSSKAQEDLIRKTYAQVCLDPKDTGYIEAHGTGTAAGDVAEVKALERVFGQNDPSASIGSVKANIGHLESAAGIIGLMKAVLVLQQARIPPVAGLENLKPDLLPLTDHIKIPRRSHRWPGKLLLRASVNSFGYGGTNAHAIVEHPSVTYSNAGEIQFVLDTRSHTPSSVQDIWDEQSGSWSTSESTSIVAPQRISPSSSIDNMRPLKQTWSLFVVSAACEKSLASSVKLLHQYVYDCIGEAQASKFYQLSYTLNERRTHLDWRAVFVSNNWTSLLESTKGPFSYQRPSKYLPEITLLFTGQGSVYRKMGIELYQSSLVFRSSLSRSQEFILELGANWSLQEVLFGDHQKTPYEGPQISQPTQTAIQIALVDLIRHYEITPHAVLGHSSGEIAAAYAAGILTQQDAIRIAYHRGRLAAQVKRRAADIETTMMVVSLEVDRVGQLINGISGASVACVNSPTSTTLSGSVQALDEISVRLHQEMPDISQKRLPVDVAYHSSFMNLIAKDYANSIKDVTHSVPENSIRFISSVNVSREITLDASYWVQNLVKPVKYKQAVEFILSNLQDWKDGSSDRIFLEIGPHSVLCPLTQQTSESWLRSRSESPSKLMHKLIFTSTMRRGKDSCQTFLQCLGNLWKAGLVKGRLDGNLASTGTSQSLTDLPPYPWDHEQQYWLENRSSRRHLFLKHGSHDLLGRLLPSSTDIQPIWQNHIDINSISWMKDHVIDGVVVFPAAAYVCMAMEALSQDIDQTPNGFHFRDLRFLKPLILSTDGLPAEVQLTLAPVESHPTINNTWRRFTISSCVDGSAFVENSTGLICADLGLPTKEKSAEIEELTASTLTKLQDQGNKPCRKTISSSFYEDLRDGGNAYGPAFQGIDRLSLHNKTAIGGFHHPRLPYTPDPDSHSSLCFHPGTLDSCVHACLPLSFSDVSKSSFVTTGIEQLYLHNSLSKFPATELRYLAIKTKEAAGRSSCNVSLVDEDKTLLLHARGVSVDSLRSDFQKDDLTACSYTLNWQPDYSFRQLRSQPSLISNSSELGELAKREKGLLLDRIRLAISRALQSVEYKAIAQPELKLFHRWMERKSTQLKLSALQNAPDASPTAFQYFRIEAELLDAVTRNLTKIMLGQENALDIMLQNDALTNIYSGQTFQPAYSQLQGVMKDVAFKDGRLNVLEIGAGSGATLKALCEGLSPAEANSLIASYKFTDISPGFFEQARVIFGHLDINLSFRKFDMNESPAVQGFQKEKYSMIIASSALHIASERGKSLHYCFELLKPGGHLVLIEAAEESLFPEFTFGALPTWWRENAQSPLLSLQTWVDLLEKTGFQFSTRLSSTSAGIADVELITAQKQLPVPAQGRKSKSAVLLSRLELKDTAASELRNSLSHILNTNPLCEPPYKVDKDSVYVVLDTHTNPLLLGATASQHKKIVSLLLQAQAILWITTSTSKSVRSAMESGVMQGLSRTARSENPDLKLIHTNIVDIDLENLGFVRESLDDLLQKLLRDVESERLLEDELIIKGDQVLIPRLRPDPSIQKALLSTSSSEKTTIRSISHGYEYDIENSTPNKHVFRPMPPKPTSSQYLKVALDAWLTKPTSHPSAATEGLPIKVIAGVGKVVEQKFDPEYETDFRIGDKVYVCGDLKVASHVFAHPEKVVKCSTSYSSAQEASFVPLYSIIYHSLKHSVGLEPQNSVLIHSNSKAVQCGLLSVVEALHCRPFVLLDTPGKHNFHDTLKPNQIVYGDSGLLYDTLSRRVGHAGLRLVLSTNPEHLPRDILSILTSSGGTLLGFTCDDGLSPSKIPVLPPGVNFIPIHADTILRQSSSEYLSSAKELIRLVNAGCVPVFSTYPTINVDDVGESLTAMNRSVAKDADGGLGALNILSFKESTTVNINSIDSWNIFDGNATYVIVGGLGGLGLEICKMMVRRGAGSVLLLTRRAVSASDKDAILQRLCPGSCEIRIVQCNPANERQLKSFVEGILPNIPPVKGVVQAAAQYGDGLLENISPEKWRTDLDSKVEVTAALVESLKGKFTLDFFMLLSSAVSILGTPGQSSYAAGNAYLDSIATFANDPEIKLVSLNLGMVSDVGAVAESSQYRKNLRFQGFNPLKSKHIINLIEHTLRKVIANGKAEQTVVGFNENSLARGSGRRLLDMPLFRHVSTSKEPSKQARMDDHMDDGKRMKEVNDRTEADKLVQQMLLQRISQMMFTDTGSLDRDTVLSELGFDSLMVVGLRMWLNTVFEMQGIKHDSILLSDISKLSELIVSSSPIFRHLSIS